MGKKMTNDLPKVSRLGKMLLSDRAPVPKISVANEIEEERKIYINQFFLPNNAKKILIQQPNSILYYLSWQSRRLKEPYPIQSLD
jgi:hypothetical protein